MVRTASIFLLCATLFGCMLASAAQAQNGPFTRTFVSASGTDANPCTVVAPCAFAIAFLFRMKGIPKLEPYHCDMNLGGIKSY